MKQFEWISGWVAGEDLGPAALVLLGLLQSPAPPTVCMSATCTVWPDRTARPLPNLTNEWKLRVDWDRAVMGDKAQVIAVPPGRNFSEQVCVRLAWSHKSVLTHTP